MNVKLDERYDLYINGRWVPASDGRVFTTTNPATGEKLAECAEATKEDVDAAVQAAWAAFPAWRDLEPDKRADILLKIADVIDENKELLATIESMDNGKPIRETMTIDVPYSSDHFRYFAGAIRTEEGTASVLKDHVGHFMNIILHEPIGVVGQIVPWNFPFLMAAWKLAPALAAGDCIVFKPSSTTSLSVLTLVKLIGHLLPPGVLNVVTGGGGRAGQYMLDHPGFRKLAFTGSTEVGRRFLEYAARSNLKRIVLELGGKSPFVVLDDVADYAAVAAQAAAAAFWNMGENCTANSRIIVPRKRKDAFTEALLAELENWRIGDPLDPENNLGSIVSEGQFRTIMGYIEKGKTEGGHILTGGAPLAIGSGLFIPPTIFDGVTPDMTIVREEIFGPVTAILPADSDEEAVGLANATAYGLQATLFTEDVTKAHKYARALKAGTVSVNCFSEGDNTTPFGGYKLSGFGGKDKGRESHDQYTETKTIFLNLDR